MWGASESGWILRVNTMGPGAEPHHVWRPRGSYLLAREKGFFSKESERKEGLVVESAAQSRFASHATVFLERKK